ncbi:MAG: nucleotidyltransferase domain-containing protein, partial [Anaerolineales bacterium]|nr:nucleotidyltransferase domain-containing protein [Anaerolineales bacterium]
EISARRKRAMTAAHKAAELLKTKFGATEVILFGSLARRSSFTLYSDIDLAARGIPSDRFYEAVGLIITFNMEFNIDLIEFETCPAPLRQNIEKDGKPL